MADVIATCIKSLEDDPWRRESPFSAEVESANRRIWNAASEEESSSALNAWLKTYQPCLFGKIAATKGLLYYCILTEEDLGQPDERIASKIQDARLQWLASAYNGNKSGFVILCASKRIAYAKPSASVKDLALRICSLYLQREVWPDDVFLDEILLRKPGQKDTIWRWDVGVNYFCAQGDGRWWNDHRIPAGMGFSMNSVGHMVKSARLSKAEKDVEDILDAPKENWDASRIDSLPLALSYAMRTIAGASNAVSGKATELLPRNEVSPKCPIDLPSELQDKDCSVYRGYYHTDYTIPSEYFVEDVKRPSDKSYSLDFSYLYRDHIDNPAYRTMGTGRQVQVTDAGLVRPSDDQIAAEKAGRMSEQDVPLRECTELLRAASQIANGH